MMSAECLMVFREWGTVAMFPALFHAVSETFTTWVAGALLTLIKGEEGNHAQGEYAIEPPLVAIDEQRSQYEVMDEEDEQIDYDMSPDDEHFLPVEFQTAVVRCPYIQAQQWCCEE